MEELLSSLTDSIFYQKHYQNATHKGTIFCLPYFFIAGFPKSESTSLDAALRKHSQIEGPSTNGGQEHPFSSPTSTIWNFQSWSN